MPPPAIRRQEKFLAWNKTLAGYVISTNERKLELITPDEWVTRKNSGVASDEWITQVVRGQLIVTAGSKVSKNEPVPPGIYETGWTPDGDPLLKQHELAPDRYIELSGVMTDILDEITWFLKSKEAYEELGLAWRRGLLLYGPPGNGKTRAIMEAAKEFSSDARVIVIPDIGVASHFRDLLSDKPAICVVEEITEMIEDKGAKEFLNFLDGVDSWPNCITIATTNYPEKLDANIVDRPSRFDKLYCVDNPDWKTRDAYLSKFLGPDEITDEVLDQTEGYSIAYLKELIVQHKLQAKPFDRILKETKDRMHTVKTCFKSSKVKVGFDSDDE